jgi:Heterokaryon incompatibility protein (HET)
MAQKTAQQTNSQNLSKDARELPTVLENDLRASRTRRTTVETLPEHTRGIAISDLPKTAQDAILITRRLGIPYLWIDSLCIIQDDKEDWLRESAKMASVYLNAYLVIGASNSWADSNGFLSPRSRDGMIKFSRKHIDGTTAYLGLQILPPEPERWTREARPGDSILDPVGHEPLASRAWCLQERYLARRMLLYGSSQLFWECAQLLAAEDGDSVPHNDYLRGLKETASIKPSIFDPRPDVDAIINCQRWYEMVAKYTICSLTHESDRLPALAGLATEVASSFGGEYLAGIWRNGMIEGLLWAKERFDLKVPERLGEHRLPSRNGPKVVGEPEKYRAPSWSWASVNGPVHFTVYKFPQRCRLTPVSGALHDTCPFRSPPHPALNCSVSQWALRCYLLRAVSISMSISPKISQYSF